MYDEIGCLTLEDRRKYQKFLLKYKIKNDMVPDYLNNLFPRVDIEQLRYGLRHLSDFVNLQRRTALFENSFIPSVIFFHCTQFTNERLHIFDSTRNLQLLNCQFVLFGSEVWTAEQNIEIVEAVHKFIKRTKPFT